MFAYRYEDFLKKSDSKTGFCLIKLTKMLSFVEIKYYIFLLEFKGYIKLYTS